MHTGKDHVLNAEQVEVSHVLERLMWQCAKLTYSILCQNSIMGPIKLWHMSEGFLFGIQYLHGFVRGFLKY